MVQLFHTYTQRTTPPRYGIGVERIMAAAIEQNSDENGIIWPAAISPFDVVITVTDIRDQALVLNR